MWRGKAGEVAVSSLDASLHAKSVVCATPAVSARSLCPAFMPRSERARECFPQGHPRPVEA